MKKTLPRKKDDVLDTALLLVEQTSLCLLNSIQNKEEATAQIVVLENICMTLQNVYLIYWRRGQFKTAKSTMNELLEQSRKAMKTARTYNLSLKNDDLWFNFGRSALVDYLINDIFDTHFLKMCSSTGVPTSVLEKHKYHIADMNFALSLSLGKSLSGYDKFMSTYFKNPRNRLTQKSFLDYGNLIDAVSKSRRDELPALVSACEENYLKRADDKNYNNFATYDGTSGLNTLHFDYRLAAILKWAYRDYPKERKKLKTIHQWKWD